MSAIAAVLLAAAAFAAEPSFPPLTGRVVDEAGILSTATRDALTALLAQHEQQTRQQVVVVTLKSLQGDSIEDYGYRLGRFWGIGEKGRDTGALLIVAPGERKVRIEVGYGLEHRLTDAISGAIIEQAILPAFRRGDVDGGVRDGVTAMLRALAGSPAPPAGATAAVPRNPRYHPSVFGALLWMLFVGLVILRAFWSIGRGGRRHSGIWYVSGSSGGWSSGGGGSSPISSPRCARAGSPTASSRPPKPAAACSKLIFRLTRPPPASDTGGARLYHLRHGIEGSPPCSCAFPASRSASPLCRRCSPASPPAMSTRCRAKTRR